MYYCRSIELNFKVVVVYNNRVFVGICIMIFIIDMEFW